MIKNELNRKIADARFRFFRLTRDWAKTPYSKREKLAREIKNAEAEIARLERDLFRVQA